MSMGHGFSPSQRVFGKTPAANHSLTAELFNPGVDGSDESSICGHPEEKTDGPKGMDSGGLGCQAAKSCEQDLLGVPGRSSDWTASVVLEETRIRHCAEGQWRGPARVVAKEVKCDALHTKYGQWQSIKDVFKRQIPMLLSRIFKSFVPGVRPSSRTSRKLTRRSRTWLTMSSNIAQALLVAMNKRQLNDHLCCLFPVW